MGSQAEIQNGFSSECQLIYEISLRGVQRRLLVECPHLSSIELDDELVFNTAVVLASFVAATVVGLVVVDEGTDLVLADAALPESDAVRVRGDEEALAGEAAALQAVLKGKDGIYSIFMSIFRCFHVNLMYAAIAASHYHKISLVLFFSLVSLRNNGAHFVQ